MKEIKDITVAFRITPTQRKMLAQAAKRVKLRPSDWIRSVVLAALFNDSATFIKRKS